MHGVSYSTGQTFAAALRVCCCQFTKKSAHSNFQINIMLNFNSEGLKFSSEYVPSLFLSSKEDCFHLVSNDVVLQKFTCVVVFKENENQSLGRNL